MRNIYITVATMQREAWTWLETFDGTGYKANGDLTISNGHALAKEISRSSRLSGNSQW